MRIDGENVHIHRQYEVVAYREVRGARRDVQGAIVLQLQQHGILRSGLVGEVQSDRGLTSSGLPVGCMWTFRTRSEPGSARQAMPSGSTHGVPPGFQNRKWLSGSKVSDSTLRSMPAKPAPGVFSCVRAERLRSNQYIRMMDGTCIAGAYLDSFDPARARNLQRQHEIPILIRSTGGQMIGGRRVDHQVRFAKLPARNERWKPGSIAGEPAGQSARTQSSISRI